MKRFVLAIALACVLSGSAFAEEIAPGDMGGGGAPAPGDPPPPGDMGNGLAAPALLAILDLVF